jgi:hypothetical protein
MPQGWARNPGARRWRASWTCSHQATSSTWRGGRTPLARLVPKALVGPPRRCGPLLRGKPVEAHDRAGHQHEHGSPPRVPVPRHSKPPPAAQPGQRPLHFPAVPPQPRRGVHPRRPPFPAGPRPPGGGHQTPRPWPTRSADASRSSASRGQARGRAAAARDGGAGHVVDRGETAAVRNHTSPPALRRAGRGRQQRFHQRPQLIRHQLIDEVVMERILLDLPQGAKRRLRIERDTELLMAIFAHSWAPSDVPAARACFSDRWVSLGRVQVMR